MTAAMWSGTSIGNILLVFLSLTVLQCASTSLLQRADTPLFYLVASSGNSANLLPLRPTGGLDGATLTGSSAIGTFYFDSGVLRATPLNPSDPPPHAYIAAIPNAQGCSTYGGLAFVAGSSSDKCQRLGTFTLQPDPQDAQLGAKLVFNGVGGFYACGSGLDVWYEIKPGAGPPDQTCNPISLYTLPVV